MTTAIELVITDLRGKLNGQLNGIESARTRAAVAFTISSAAVAVFAPKLLKHPGNLAVLAVVSFILTAVSSIYVLMPHLITLWPEADGWTEWTKQYQAYLDENSKKFDLVDQSGALLASRMADDMAEWYGTNKCTYNRVQYFLSAAFMFALIEIGLWAAALFS